MNVLLITTDQHKATTLGAYGDALEATPNLDALAGRGTTFTRARTQNPYCMPARAAILTGTYPSSSGVVRNGIDLPAGAARESLAAAFSTGGFSTSLFGKAHFASYYPDLPTGAVESVPDAALVAHDWFGPYFGFDHVELTSDVHNIRLAPAVGRWNWGFGPPPMGLHYGRHLFRHGRDKGVERLRLMQPEADGREWDPTQTWRNHLPEEEHHTHWIADRAIEWLGEVDRPFFCWVSFPDPHHPFDPPAPWCDRYRPADMLEVLPAAHPEEFARKPPHHQAWTQGFRGTELEWANPGWALFSEHEQLSILAAYWGMIAQIDSSIGRILGALTESGLADDTLVVFTSDHGDFMGEHQMILKGPLHYQALLQVPLIVAGPGVAVGGSVDAPVGTIDLAPTLLSSCGLEVPPHMEGTSLFGEPRSHVLTEDDVAPGVFQLRTLTTERFRITHDLVNPPNSELYDLIEDPGELSNRWSDPALGPDRAELLATLEDLTVAEPRRRLPQVCSAG
ncbi:MAG: Arylsulfatase [Acidimicrobiales bacterium]|nr:Arylsulfatase [Acidimicrobiales bacterium]